MGSLIPTPSYTFVVILGFITLTALLIQLLVGYRKIKFKGRTHLKVHRTLAWVMLAIALTHMTAGLIYSGFSLF